MSRQAQGRVASPERLSPEWFDCVFPAHYLRQRVDYDPETGVLTWRDFKWVSLRWRSRNVGKPAFDNLMPNGYLRGALDGHSFASHRVAWAIQTGFWPVLQIDHINRVRSDNRFVNLREVSQSENRRNLRPEGSGRVPALGVSFRKGLFVARIGSGDEALGSFSQIEDAVAARYQAEIAHGWPPRAETLEQAQAAAKAAWLSRLN